MYTALRPHEVQCSVTRPAPCSSSGVRGGVRSTADEPQEGHTRGLWSRSAEININASGARYSFMPRRPTVGPSGGNDVNRSLGSHPAGIYGRPRWHAKTCTAFQMCVAAPLLVAVPDIAAAQTTHVVRLEVDVERDVHRFVPGRITARAGDILLFRVSS